MMSSFELFSLSLYFVLVAFMSNPEPVFLPNFGSCDEGRVDDFGVYLMRSFSVFVGSLLSPNNKRSNEKSKSFT